jgi:hypothetical protein
VFNTGSALATINIIIVINNITWILGQKKKTNAIANKQKKNKSYAKKKTKSYAPLEASQEARVVKKKQKK